MAQAENLLRLPHTPAKQTRVASTSKRAVKALRRQTITAGLVGGVAVALTALSLHDLAEGVRIVTHSATWQSYAMASGIDLGFISTELAMLTASDKERKAIAKFANPAIIGTLCGSAVMNAFAFRQGCRQHAYGRRGHSDGHRHPCPDLCLHANWRGPMDFRPQQGLIAANGARYAALHYRRSCR
jgi:hypothetical protein